MDGTSLRVFISPLNGPLPFDRIAKSGNGTSGRGINSCIFNLGTRKHCGNRPLANAKGVNNVLTLHNRKAPFPMRTSFHSNGAHITFSNIIGSPVGVNNISLQLGFSNSSLNSLCRLANILLPSAPPFRASNQLMTGVSARGSSIFSCHNFGKQVNSDSVRNSLICAAKGPQPGLRNSIRSQRLQLTSLKPLVNISSKGKTRGSGQSRRGGNRGDIRPTNGILPCSHFRASG